MGSTFFDHPFLTRGARGAAAAMLLGSMVLMLFMGPVSSTRARGQTRAAAAPTQVGQAVRVKDINLTTGDLSPLEAVSIGSALFFSAENKPREDSWPSPATTYELWVSDLTGAGARVLRRFASARPQLLTRFGNRLYFFAPAKTGEALALWRSDGTAAGTVQVKALNASPGARLRYSTDLAGRLVFFVATLGDTSTHFPCVLWRSDGTAAGTIQVLETNCPGYVEQAGGSLLFDHSDPVSGRELWRSDGTAAGTRLLKDIYPGARGSLDFAHQGNSASDGAVVYFNADDGSHGAELWRSDGTAAGTVLAHDLVPGQEGSGPRTLTTFNGALYFVAADPTFALYKTDGAHTVLLKEGARTPLVQEMAGVGSRLFFSLVDDRTYVTGRDLWVTDGTAAGTVLVKALDRVTQLRAVGQRLLFQASNAEHGSELWSSDGTAAGTMLVKDIHPTGDIRDAAPAALAVIGDRLYFAATSPTTGREIWTSDGTAANTSLLRDLRVETNSSNPGGLLNSALLINGTFYFAADNGVEGWELWKSNGSASTTVLVKDIAPGLPGSRPANFVNYGGTLYFTASAPDSGLELWRSDGTAAGTTLVKDIYAGASSSAPDGLTVYNGLLYFAAADGDQGRELWRSDGTAAGTTLFVDASAGGAALASTPSQLLVANGQLYFTVRRAGSGFQVWKSDGTAAGTVKVVDVASGAAAGNLAYANGHLFFAAHEAWPSSKTLLWASDGTAAGTRKFADRPLYNNTLVAYKNAVYVAAGTDVELWKSNGLQLVRVKDLYAGPGNSSYPVSMRVVRGLLYFSAYTAAGRELWRSDGSAAGTWQIKDINPGPGSALPSALLGVGGALYFTADNGAQGHELWASQGGHEDAQLVQELQPGPRGSAPRLFPPGTTRIYLSAQERATGRELWVAPLASGTTPTPTSTASPTPTRTASPTPPPVAEVSIVNFAFEPGATTIGANGATTVRWTNAGTAPHTVTFVSSTAGLALPASGTLAPGQSWSFTFPSGQADYTYRCDIHPSMTGSLRVVAASPPSTP